MKALGLFLVFALAKAAALPGHALPHSWWTPTAYLGQDALVALVFAVFEKFTPPRDSTIVFWVLTAYAALNIPVMRAVSTPVTVPMIRAAGGPLADLVPALSHVAQRGPDCSDHRCSAGHGSVDTRDVRETRRRMLDGPGCPGSVRVHPRRHGGLRTQHCHRGCHRRRRGCFPPPHAPPGRRKLAHVAVRIRSHRRSLLPARPRPRPKYHYGQSGIYRRPISAALRR